MTYDETLEYLYRFAPMFQQVGSSAYKEGMENSFLIDKHLNHPHAKYKTIHVGGTNGKGSTSHLLASILQEAGYKTGLYTSPHLLDFRERIKVNGEMIDKAFIVDFFASNQAFFESIQPSFFELTTGMAFAFFAERNVDIAVIEVGLGGRLDCTNVITPVLSIITNISFDHTQLLGNTLTAIAREKAGIIKPGVPVVIGEAEGEVKKFFEAYKVSLQTPCHPVLNLIQDHAGFPEKPDTDYQEIVDLRFAASVMIKDYPGLACELRGWVQKKNTATVLSAINLLKKDVFSISKEAVYRGFRYVIKNTGLMGRWQVVGKNPEIVLDTGHNVAGIKYIVQQLQSEKYEQLHIIFGMVNDKDIVSVLALLPKNANYYFTRALIPRALDSGLLAEQAKKFGLQGQIFSTVSDAFSTAKQNAKEKDFIFVGGSTFVVADALRIIHNS
jgi:dihydrofolate synthase/folylpolyglutamate synthase